MINEKKPSNDIMSAYFYSPDGLYSDLVIKSGFSVKIVSISTDDVDSNPVILYNGYLKRCTANNIYACIKHENLWPNNDSIAYKSPVKVSIL